MMTTTEQRTFEERTGFYWVCVAPATILSDEHLPNGDGGLLPSLREEASTSGLCYVRVLRSLYDGTYLARVAASLDLLQSDPITVLLTEAQLYHAFPYDCRTTRMAERSVKAVCSLLHTHAAEVRPLVKVAAVPEARTQPKPIPAAVAFEAKHVQSVEVSAEDLQEALGLSPTDITTDAAAYAVQKSTYHMQQAFLRAAIDTLMTQLYAGQERMHALAIKARCALIARVERWHRQTRQQVVNAVLAFDGQRQRMAWQLTIGVPAAVDLAA